MEEFNIDDIRYGWFFASLDGNALICSNVWERDDPRALLRCLGDICVRRREEVWTAFAGEPGAVLLQLSLKGSDIDITAFSSEISAWDLPEAPSELPIYGDRILWQASVDAVSLLDAVVTAFALYADGNGLALYRAHWGAFPQEEFDALKRFALTVSHGREARDEEAGLFCASFLKP